MIINWHFYRIFEIRRSNPNVSAFTNLHSVLFYIIFDYMSQIVKTPPSTTPPPIQGKESVILDAARKRFAHFGYSKVTMEEVADDIGVVKGCIYYYFETKEDLFKAVIRKEQNQFILDIIGLPVTSVPFPDRLRNYVEKRQHYFKEMVNLSQLDYQSWAKITSHFKDIFNEFEKQELNIIQKIFHDGNKAEEFFLPDPHKAAVVFLHILQGLRFRTLRELRPPELDDKIYSQLNHEIKLFVEIFLSGITNKSIKIKA